MHQCRIPYHYYYKIWLLLLQLLLIRYCFIAAVADADVLTPLLVLFSKYIKCIQIFKDVFMHAMHKNKGFINNNKKANNALHFLNISAGLYLHSLVEH